MRKERKILRFIPQKLRKRFANGNPTLHAMCISGSNLESKMGEAVQCFMDDGEAAGRRSG